MKAAMDAVNRLWLIAAREFNAYVATASFWVALLIGPLAMGGVLAVGSLAMAPGGKVAVAIHATDAKLAAAASDALAAATKLEGKSTAGALSDGGPAAITVRRAAGGAVDVSFDGPVALSPAGRALVVASIERDDALSALGRSARPVALAPAAQTSSPSPVSIASLCRFALVMMLWLTLTGSLGMLLQAVVRERANRALETLLAAAQPWEIVYGKLAGVGGVSILVLIAWLGSSAGLTALAPHAGGALAPFFQVLGQPPLLAYAAVLYVSAFLLFGLITVAVGTAAADTAAAQNLSRPMFAVLLAVFFAALAATGGASDKLAWLVFAPPFTPFMLLLKTPSPVTQILAFGLMVGAIVIAGRLAVHGLSLKPDTRIIPWPILKQPKPNLS